MNASGLTVRQGDVIAGKYVVERMLGGGAMGVVVLAMHTELQERRAIKLMSRDALRDPTGIERFLREARAAVKLKSQHVARVHDMGRLPDQSPFIVLEYLEGSDLRRLIESRGPLPVAEAVGYLLQACEAIGEAHSLGIVHRDLKPANLFVTRDVNGAASIKVFDFGIAKLVSPQENVSLTSTSSMLGTPLYMSPEQMRGALDLDGRADIWALGAVLYCMLTGRPPFTGSTVTEICAAVIADPPKSPELLRPDIPPAVTAAIMRCLAKRPSDRFATIAELAAVLRPFAEGGRAVAMPTTMVPSNIAAPSAPLASLPEAMVPAASAQSPALGANTGQASWWSANGTASRPRASSSKRGVAILVGVLLLAAAAFGVNRYRTASVSVAGPASATLSRATAHAASQPVDSSAMAPSSVAQAAASETPAATSASASTAAPTPASAPVKRPAAPPPPKDAFGRERK